jgi:para-nitrobenzyl esterase
VRVETAYGVVEGECVSAPEGSPVYRFLGVPFAGTTAGPGRFRAPVALEPWAGVRAADAYGSSAPQADSLPTALPWFEPAAISEDCLSLNVWTPGLHGEPRPVMVWIHGGAYTSGGSAQAVYDAARLAAEGDVVVVTINYRLGALGFLAPGGDADASCGLLDQLAALDWTREHATGFGGDAGCITVFGESAGAGSILHLAVSPLAEGAFDRAIVQSGEPRTLTAEEGQIVATTFARHLGLDDVDLARLRTLPLGQLLDAQVATAAELMGTVGMMPFAPVIDGHVCDTGVLDGFRAGRAASLPLVIGTTRDELLLFPDPRSETLDDERLLRWMDRIGAEQSVAEYRTLLGGDVTPGEVWEAVRTDVMMRQPNLRVAEAQREHQPATYVYRFDWSAPGLGAVHAVDIPFTFGTFDREGWADAVGYDQRAERLGSTLRAAWTSFARTGAPGWPAHDLPDRPTKIFGPTG